MGGLGRVIPGIDELAPARFEVAEVSGGQGRAPRLGDGGDLSVWNGDGPTGGSAGGGDDRVFGRASLSKGQMRPAKTPESIRWTSAASTSRRRPVGIRARP
jgi:hypothetical protein